MKQLSKAEILAHIEQEHNLLVQTFHALSQSQQVEQSILAAPAPGQSCKDVLAHLTAWEQRMLSIIRAILTGAPHPEYPSTPKFNEHVFHANKDRPLEKVTADFERSFNETLALVQQLTETQLATGELWKLVGYNTYNHYKWARMMIRRWQRAHRTSPSGQADGA
jgi:hypothetical protein